MESRALCVVVIDDEDVVRKSVTLYLRKAGCIIHATTDARKAVDLVRQTRPDVILCDAAMPYMSGPEVIEILKAHEETAHIPIVLMTGFAESHMFGHVGWTGFLGKPFNAVELIAALHHAVSASRATLSTEEKGHSNGT